MDRSTSFLPAAFLALAAFLNTNAGRIFVDDETALTSPADYFGGSNFEIEAKLGGVGKQADKRGNRLEEHEMVSRLGRTSKL